MSKYLWRPDPKPPKTRGEVIFGRISGWVIGFIIISVVIDFLDWLFHPFRTKSSEDFKANLAEKIEKKQELREAYYRALSEDQADPMVQFYQRKLDKLEEYRRDSDTAYYIDWFNKWQRGLILDTTLRWAPPIYNDNDDIQSNFIKYMRRQLKLHQEKSWFKQKQFLSVVKKYYPEFSASSLKTFERDLSAYETEVCAMNVEQELKQEIADYKLSEHLVNYLLSDDVPSRKLLKTAEALKKASDYGFSDELCIYLVEHKINPESATADIIGRIDSELDLPARIGHLYAQKKLTFKQLLELSEKLSSASDIIPGVLAYYDGKETVYDRIIEDKLKEFRVRNL